MAPAEHLVKRGWLWKRAVGKSVILGRKNWKLRFVESDADSLRYYSAEPFLTAQSCIYWSDVLYVYDKAPAEEKGLEAAYDGNLMGCAKPPPPTPSVSYSGGRSQSQQRSGGPGQRVGGRGQTFIGGRWVSASSAAAASAAANAAAAASSPAASAGIPIEGHDPARFDTMYNNSYDFPNLAALDAAGDGDIDNDSLLGNGGGGGGLPTIGASPPSNAAAASGDKKKAGQKNQTPPAPKAYLPTRNYFEMCAAGENPNSALSAMSSISAGSPSASFSSFAHGNGSNSHHHHGHHHHHHHHHTNGGNSGAAFKASNATREIYYFGLRFKQGDGLLGRGSERVLLFRTDDAEDHAAWVRYLRRVAELYSFTDDEDNAAGGGGAGGGGGGAPYQSGVVERVSRRLRTIVSLQKQRFTNDGFDLDLSYVLPNVIAMGFPCEGREELFRNPMSHVVRFFDTYHKKEFHVINLCSERFYLPNRFGGKFDRFPFDDHNPCPLALLYDICENMYDKLVPSPRTDPRTGRLIEPQNPCLTPKCVIENVYSLQHTEFPVVAVHCKAGKGRTGLVICAYLMYAGICHLPEDAMSLFAARRTKDGKGIQIPSQRRYLAYLYQSLHNYAGQIPTNVVRIRGVSVNVKPKDSGRGEYGGSTTGEGEYFVRIEQRHPTHHRHKPMGQEEGSAKDPLVTVHDTSAHGHFAEFRQIEGGGGADASLAADASKGGFLSSILKKKTSNEELYVRVGATLRGVSDFRIALYSVGASSGAAGAAGGGGGAPGLGAEAIYWCSVWLHTGFMPTNSHTIRFPKMDIDDAAKDKKHNRFPSEFTMTVEFSVDGPGAMQPAPKKAIPCLDLL